MESSAVVAFRALIMVACLVLVPLAAIFGSAFPEVVKTNLVDRFWPSSKTTDVAHNGHVEAPRFGDSTSLNPSHAAVPTVGSHEAAGDWPAGRDAATSGVRTVGNAPARETGRATPAQYSAPAESNTPAWPPAGNGVVADQDVASLDTPPRSSPVKNPSPTRRLASGNPLASNERLTSTGSQPNAGQHGFSAQSAADVSARNDSASPEPRRDRPSAYGSGSEAPGATGTPGAREVSPGRPAAVHSADFIATERRLRQYGAAYYRLETVGNGGLEYRFFCMLPASAGMPNPKQFEAVDSDPLVAMTRVADDVQAWLDRQ